MFADGTDFELIFDAPAGRVQLFAEVHIAGTHLTLNELLFYPEHAEEALELGVKDTLEIFRLLRALASSDGFRRLTVTYHRVGARHDGRTMTFTRELA